jgi:NOL1/NOP2/sun family putative RNA methylase
MFRFYLNLFTCQLQEPSIFERFTLEADIITLPHFCETLVTDSRPPIPPLFLDRMSSLMGVDFDAFAAALELAPVSGLRVNTLKCSVKDFAAQTPIPLGEKIPWCDSAFLLPPSEQSAGQHPYHRAGLYYLQDPSAMSPAELLAPQPGEKVLDLSAAPGGKTTHIAALMQGRGLLVANEIKDKRVGHLAQNVERWGAGNIVVTNETPERLADHLGPIFDRVLVDAPCSGEGMFRKDMGARADWSPEMILGCAARQYNILRVAARLVKPGGYLLYSTCTFAPEEDEGAVQSILDAFPDFSVAPLPLFDGFIPGQPGWLEALTGQQAESARAGAARLFPHRLAGEGHFACLLKRAEGENPPEEREKAPRKRDTPDLRFWREFAGATLNIDLAEDRLRVFGVRLYFIPEVTADFSRLRVVHPGVWLGTFKKNRFEPAHPLALFLRRGEAKNTLDLPPESPELAAYLRGEPLESTGQPGWLVIAADGWPLGWGKRVQGVVKNHYPRGWM